MLAPQDLGHRATPDVELVSKLADSETALVASDQIVNNVSSKSPMNMLDGSSLGRFSPVRYIF